MDALKRLTSLPAPQRAGIAIAVLATIGFLIGIWSWLQTPDYRMLFANLGDRDGGAVVASLAQMNVPYRFNDGGSAILVPSGLVYDTRLKLASQGLPKGGTVGYEILDGQKFGTTQLQEQINFQRGLEGELAKSIQAVSAVQTARVHLAIPRPTIFLRERQKPTASVLLTLFPGKTLDGAQVQGIVHLVASSVPELADQSVSLVDGSGNLLSRGAETNGLDPGKLAYVHELEQAAQRRVAAILEPIVGAGNARVEITADVDFSQTERTAETFAPNGAPEKSAMRSQQLAAANASTKKDATVNYELDRTVETKRMPTGTIRRLSAAIVVNNRAVAAKRADAKPADSDETHRTSMAAATVEAVGVATSEPLRKEEIDQITALAREAMGFDEKRGDSINVVNASFSPFEAPTAADVPMWKDPDNVSTAKEVAKNLGFALVAAYLLFGVLRPAIRKLTAMAPQPVVAKGPGHAGEAPAPGSPELLQRARQLARDDPKAIAGLVRSWVAAE